MLTVVAVRLGGRVCAGNTHNHCYGFYPATVVTVPFEFQKVLLLEEMRNVNQC